MTKNAAEIISQYGGEVRDDYSGRGMYGKSTSGIVFESEKEFFQAIAELLEEDDENDRHEVAKALRKINTDSMGRSIIYY